MQIYRCDLCNDIYETPQHQLKVNIPIGGAVAPRYVTISAKMAPGGSLHTLCVSCLYRAANALAVELKTFVD